MTSVKNKFSLTSYLPTVWSQFELELIGLLGIPKNISLGYQDYSPSRLQFELQFPNKKRLVLEISGWQNDSFLSPSDNKGFWIREGLWFGSSLPQDSNVSDDFLIQSLVALKKFIVRKMKKILRTQKNNTVNS